MMFWMIMTVSDPFDSYLKLTLILECMGYEYDNPFKADDTKMWSFKVKSGVKDTVSLNS